MVHMVGEMGQVSAPSRQIPRHLDRLGDAKMRRMRLRTQAVDDQLQPNGLSNTTMVLMHWTSNQTAG